MMVESFRSAITGLRRQFGLWTWLYAVKLVLALLVTLPVLVILSAPLDKSIFARPVLSSWSIDVIAEVVATNPRVVPLFLSSVLLMGILAFVVKQFLNGGIYTSFLHGAPMTMADFLSACARHFRGNLKISLGMLLLYVPIAMLSVMLFLAVPEDAFGQFGEEATYDTFAGIGLMYLLFLPAGILSDVLRLYQAGHPDAALKSNLREILNFCLQSIVKLLGVLVSFFILFALIWIAIEKASSSVTSALTGMLGVILELVLFQFCSWLRTGVTLVVPAAAGPLVADAFPTGAAGEDTASD